MDTDKHLKDSFAGESQANRKYTAFALKADEEGYRSSLLLTRIKRGLETSAILKLPQTFWGQSILC